MGIKCTHLTRKFIFATQQKNQADRIPVEYSGNIAPIPGSGKVNVIQNCDLCGGDSVLGYQSTLSVFAISITSCTDTVAMKPAHEWKLIALNDIRKEQIVIIKFVSS